MKLRNSYRVVNLTLWGDRSTRLPYAQVRYWWWPFSWVTLPDGGVSRVELLEEICHTHAHANQSSLWEDYLAWREARRPVIIKDLGKLP